MFYNAHGTNIELGIFDTAELSGWSFSFIAKDLLNKTIEDLTKLLSAQIGI